VAHGGEIAFPVQSSSQVSEVGLTPQLDQGLESEANCFLLRGESGEQLRLRQEVIVNVNVGAHLLS
jgi:hypothetical protein